MFIKYNVCLKFKIKKEGVKLSFNRIYPHSRPYNWRVQKYNIRKSLYQILEITNS